MGLLPVFEPRKREADESCSSTLNRETTSRALHGVTGNAELDMRCAYALRSHDCANCGLLVRGQYRGGVGRLGVCRSGLHSPRGKAAGRR
jgi:hypothetical protein